MILEVQDYGRGILVGEREKVFDKFYRADNTGGESGAGIGLYLVREILQAHGGTVELESKIGSGSRFRLVFPAGLPLPAKANDPASISAAGLKSSRVG